MKREKPNTGKCFAFNIIFVGCTVAQTLEYINLDAEINLIIYENLFSQDPSIDYSNFKHGTF